MFLVWQGFINQQPTPSAMLICSCLTCNAVQIRMRFYAACGTTLKNMYCPGNLGCAIWVLIPLPARLLVIGAILRNSLQNCVLLVHDCLTAHVACGNTLEIKLILVFYRVRFHAGSHWVLKNSTKVLHRKSHIIIIQLTIMVLKGCRVRSVH